MTPLSEGAAASTMTWKHSQRRMMKPVGPNRRICISSLCFLVLAGFLKVQFTSRHVDPGHDPDETTTSGSAARRRAGAIELQVELRAHPLRFHAARRGRTDSQRRGDFRDRVEREAACEQKSCFGRISGPFPPAAAHGLLLSALAAAIA